MLQAEVRDCWTVDSVLWSVRSARKNVLCLMLRSVPISNMKTSVALKLHVLLS